MPRALLAAAPWLCATALVASAGAEPLAAPTLEALMAGMARTAGVRGEFVERKEIALLSEPIESRGTLVFVPPDRLLRTTREPSRSRLVIAGERFSFEDEAGGDAVDLSANPVARGFVENFIVLWSGDLAALRERYEPSFFAEGEAWRLELRPRRRPLADLVERITLRGSGPALGEMELLEKDGDRTTTRFESLEVDHRFTPEELATMFGAAASTGAE